MISTTSSRTAAGNCATLCRRRWQPSKLQSLLIGAYFMSEYSLQSAALFNPSVVPHPDQSGVAPGALRLVMSLRATGEGHISSIEFREGVSQRRRETSRLPRLPTRVTMPEIRYPHCRKTDFIKTLCELGLDERFVERRFRHSQREDFAPCGVRGNPALPGAMVLAFRHQRLRLTSTNSRSVKEAVRWAVHCDYLVLFPPSLALSGRVLFPGIGPSEQNGIEDARFVRFCEDRRQPPLLCHLHGF